MKWFNKFLVGLVISVFALAANADVLDFDDLRAGYYLAGTGYGGFDWTNFKTPFATSVNGGYPVAPTSGNRAILNASGRAASVSLLEGGLFDFNSAQLTAAWNDGLNVTVQGWLNGVVTYTQTVVVNTSGPQLFDFDFLGIDKLTFTAAGGVLNSAFAGKGSGTHFVMDDFTFNVSAVPEPSTYAMMLGGLAMLGLMVHKRTKI